MSVNDRILSVRFRGKETNTTIYAPTSTTEEIRERFYTDLLDKLDRVPKGDTMVIMGDFNAKVGCTLCLLTEYLCLLTEYLHG